MSLKMRILPVVGAAVIRLLGTTWRLEWDSPELLVKARAISPKVIFVSWHGRMLPMSYSHRDQGVQISIPVNVCKRERWRPICAQPKHHLWIFSKRSSLAENQLTTEKDEHAKQT